MSDPQIYVKGFGNSCRQGDLKQCFEKFGEIVEVRKIRDYAFIVYRNKQEVDKAVKEMDGESFQGNRLRVEVAGRPQRKKGPQPNDECRYCRRLGHWQNDCPEYRERRRRRRRSYSSSSSSSSSSSDSERSRSRRKRRSKKTKKHSRKRSESSESSRSSYSSSSRSSSDSRPERKEKPNQEGQK